MFIRDWLQKEIGQGKIKGKIEALRKEAFDVPSKKLLDMKEYFALCTYDEDDGYYCFHMEDACEKMHGVIQGFLEEAQTTFPEEVEEVYGNFANAFCDMLKNRLAEL